MVDPMTGERFLELEFMTLRKEIEQTKERTFRIIIGGATVIPAAQFLAQVYQIAVVTVLLPFLVAIIVLVFLSENNALMRCGRYIKNEIEPKIDGVLGWETWLEQPSPLRRAVDKYMNYSFYLLSAVYYLLSVVLASEFIELEYGLVGYSVMLGVYVFLGLGLAALLVAKVRSTSTAYDLPSSPLQRIAHTPKAKRSY